MTKAESERLRKQYADLVARPADEIRTLAVRQRSLTSEALKKVRDGAGDLVGRWAVYDRLDEDVAAQLRIGDDLEQKQDEESRVARRRAYARAYQLAALAAEEVGRERGEGATWVAWFKDSAQGVADAAEAIGSGAGKVIKKVAETGESVVFILAIGAAAALVAYGKSKGRR